MIVELKNMKLVRNDVVNSDKNEGKKINKFTLFNYNTFSGVQYKKLDISFQIFGQPLHTAPIVLVNHALTGNSNVTGNSKSWWSEIIGTGKVIDTKRYTVIAFNIPGNGYDNILIKSYKDFIAKDIAQIFYLVLKEFGVNHLFAIIGGSLGGGIAWEMASLYPTFSDYVIPIAADWKSTDWIIAHNAIQESILKNSQASLKDARKMAMLFYRSPESLQAKFKRSKTEKGNLFKVESWLNYHGDQLEERFQTNAYLMMNHLLTSLDATLNEESFENTFKGITSKIIQVAIDSDLFFIKEENMKTKKVLDKIGIKNEYHELNSIHGHDAFLIEHKSLSSVLNPIFKSKIHLKEEKMISFKKENKVVRKKLVVDVNVAVVGKGNVGSSLINQIISAQKNIERKQHFKFNIFAIAGSKHVLLNKEGSTYSWDKDFESDAQASEDISNQIIDFAKENNLENLVLIDNTASSSFVAEYDKFLDADFDLISSNKIANSQSFLSYKKLRDKLQLTDKQFLYETNVGAGLPVIDTLRNLYDSGDKVTRIRGVFSGTLSYLFNSFSESDKPFGFFVKEAMSLGLTEPDPREDLSGQDVARKLLILAREIDLISEFSDIEVQNLIPENLSAIDKNTFLSRLEELDDHYDTLRSNLKKNEVLRYVADLKLDNPTEGVKLSVKLTASPANSKFGNLKGSESIFEIFTETYQQNPVSIIGAGAGAEVTARGVFVDLLKVARQKK